MDEARARAILGVPPGATLAQIDDAWEKSDRSTTAADAARILRTLRRADAAIHTVQRVASWADADE
jgi:hypothetical protein